MELLINVIDKAKTSAIAYLVYYPSKKYTTKNWVVFCKQISYDNYFTNFES